MAEDDGLLNRAYEGLANIDLWLAQYHRDFRTQISDAERARGEARGRIMLLAAAIVGLVVPLLAKEPSLMDSRPTLKLAAGCWLFSLGVAAIGQASDRHTLRSIRARFNESAEKTYDLKLAQLNSVLGRGPMPGLDSDVVKENTRGVNALDDARKDREKLADVEDVLVYGAFIIGVAILVWGLW